MTFVCLFDSSILSVLSVSVCPICMFLSYSGYHGWWNKVDMVSPQSRLLVLLGLRWCEHVHCKHLAWCEARWIMQQGACHSDSAKHCRVSVCVSRGTTTAASSHGPLTQRSAVSIVSGCAHSTVARSLDDCRNACIKSLTRPPWRANYHQTWNCCSSSASVSFIRRHSLLHQSIFRSVIKLLALWASLADQTKTRRPWKVATLETASNWRRWWRAEWECMDNVSQLTARLFLAGSSRHVTIYTAELQFARR